MQLMKNIHYFKNEQSYLDLIQQLEEEAGYEFSKLVKPQLEWELVDKPTMVAHSKKHKYKIKFVFHDESVYYFSLFIWDKAWDKAWDNDEEGHDRNDESDACCEDDYETLVDAKAAAQQHFEDNYNDNK
jgi:hypothetical protein